MSHVKITTGSGYCYLTRNGVKVCNLHIEQQTGMLVANLSGGYTVHWTPTGRYDIHYIHPYDIVECIERPPEAEGAAA